MTTFQEQLDNQIKHTSNYITSKSNITLLDNDTENGQVCLLFTGTELDCYKAAYNNRDKKTFIFNEKDTFYIRIYELFSIDDINIAVEFFNKQERERQLLISKFAKK